MHIFRRRNLGLISALSIIAFAGGCTGFFVNPTLSSIAIGPTNQTITVSPKRTLQMSATGTFSDGSTQDLTGKVSWISSDTSCASISAAGLVSPPTTVSGGVCTSNITAEKGTVSSSAATITVSQGTPSVITLTVNGSQGTVALTPNTSNNTVLALATFQNVSSEPDITASCTWNNSDTTDLTLTNGSNTITVAATPTNSQATLSCSFGGTQSNTVTLTF